MNTKEEITHLFKLYLEGNTSPSQEERLFSILKEKEMTLADLEESTQGIWEENSTFRDDSPAAQAELQSIWDKIAEEEEPAQRITLSWLKYAASLILVCAAALGWYSLKIKDPEHAVEVRMISKTTKSGERLKLRLPDSSVVYLNALSKISFPSHFEKGKQRTIHLEGEAFFEVQQDVSRPFIVQSGKLETRVLGTSFNVEAYPGTATFSVSVRSGKVGVSAKSDGKVQHLSFLTPGKQLIYQLKSKQYSLNELPVTEINSWTENKFVFRNEALSMIIPKLERSYQVDFKLKNPELLKCRFNATFANQNIQGIMEQLQIMTGGKIHYKFDREKTTITLWGEACE